MGRRQSARLVAKSRGWCINVYDFPVRVVILRTSFRWRENRHELVFSGVLPNMRYGTVHISPAS